MKDSVCVI